MSPRQPFVIADVLEGELAAADSLLLCSDGLSKGADDLEVARAMSTGSLEERVGALLALSCSDDDATIVVVGGTP